MTGKWSLAGCQHACFNAHTALWARVFEGLRAYETAQPAIFRLQEHTDRLYNWRTFSDENTMIRLRLCKPSVMWSNKINDVRLYSPHCILWRRSNGLQQNLIGSCRNRRLALGNILRAEALRMAFALKLLRSPAIMSTSICAAPSR